MQEHSLKKFNLNATMSIRPHRYIDILQGSFPSTTGHPADPYSELRDIAKFLGCNMKYDKINLT
ncbi:MAG: hypothetical protein RLY40_1475 [Pseudomonadota bacterium]|jgi:hypothetical protein